MQHRLKMFMLNDCFNPTFSLHLENLIMEANHKLHAMGKVKRYKAYEQNKLIGHLL